MLRSRRRPLGNVAQHGTRPRRLDAGAYARLFAKPPGIVDQWLDRAYRQAATSGYPFVMGESVPTLDYGPYAVICRVERVIHNPIEDPDSMFTESSRYELYLTTMMFVLRDTPFALHTSSRILLETYVGSPGEQGAPLWMSLEYNLFEFVQSQADLSKFLAEFGQTEKSQYVVTFVGDHLLQHYLDHRASLPTKRRRIFDDSSNTR